MGLLERRAIVFDFDGTIADTKASIISTATSVLVAWGLPAEELPRMGEIIGPPFPQAFEQVFGLSHADAVEVTRRYRSIYHHLGLTAWPAFPGMVELLVELRSAGRTLAVASSKQASLVRRGLADNGILDLFATVRAKESDSEGTKTNAIMRALDDMGVGPGDAVMVGDRFHDVEAARACDLPCVGVLYGGTADRSELAEAGAAAIAESTGELREILVP